MTTADQVIATASQEIGQPYVWGGESLAEGGFDCSGLVQWTLGKLGISAPRTARAQQDWVTPVTEPRPGDLVFWGRPAYHVGIYLGGGRMLDAPHRGAKVGIRDVWGTPSGYGRIPGISGPVGAAAVGVSTAVGTATGLAGAAVSTVLGGARNVVLEAVVAGLGLALVGVGIWRAVSPKKENA